VPLKFLSRDARSISVEYFRVGLRVRGAHRAFIQSVDINGDSEYEVVTKITYAGWRITYAEWPARRRCVGMQTM
jgi:hypothetical protein